MSKKYKVINTTIKKPIINPKTGADMRPTINRVGHNVSFRLDTGERVEVERHRPRIVPHVNEGMLRLQRGGYIRIESIDDVTDILQKHTLDSKKPDLFKPDDHVKSEGRNETVESEVAHSSASKVKAVQMGEDTYAQRSGAEMEGAINPDGDPNFVVKADKNAKRSKKGAQPEVEEPTI